LSESLDLSSMEEGKDVEADEQYLDDDDDDDNDDDDDGDNNNDDTTTMMTTVMTMRERTCWEKILEECGNFYGSAESVGLPSAINVVQACKADFIALRQL
jgi:hypothetical protein